MLHLKKDVKRVQIMKNSLIRQHIYPCVKPKTLVTRFVKIKQVVNRGNPVGVLRN